jgi:hypothetical protein
MERNSARQDAGNHGRQCSEWIVANPARQRECEHADEVHSTDAAALLVASLVVKSVIVLALIGGFVGGAIQPYLFAGVKYQ